MECKWCGEPTNGIFDGYCGTTCRIAHNKAEYSKPKICSGSDSWFIGIAMLLIAFLGDPDLVTALIYFLMK